MAEMWRRFTTYVRDGLRRRGYRPHMPMFTVHIINHALITETTLDDQRHADDALATGVHGALMIAVDELRKTGAAAVAAEVIVEDADHQMLRRSAVSVSVAPLAVGPVGDRIASPSDDGDGDGDD